MRKISIFIAFFFIGTMFLNAQISIDPFSIKPTTSEWETRYQNRVNELDNGYTWSNHSNDTDDGKRYWPPLLADMKNAEGDASALQALIDGRGADGLNSSYAGTFYKAFSCPGYTMYYFKYKDKLPDIQKNKIESVWNSTGLDYTTREDHKMDPIYSCTEFNSENFSWMARLAGYLMAHEFNDTRTVNGKTAMAYFDEYVRNWVRGTYCAGRVEWNSHVYSGFCFQAALTLYENAQDTEIRKMARAVLDWIVMENALHYLDGNLVGPDSRDKGNGYKDFEGSGNGWNYVHFADDDYHPHLSIDYIDDKFSGIWTIGFIKQATYRPPQVLIDIAQRKFNMPVELHNAKPFYWLDEKNYADWQGNTFNSRRFEFEFQYIDENYTLASLASGRPSGWIGTFSEQSVWKLGVMGTGTSGATVLYGNSGNYSDGAGRCKYEQIGQYRNAMMRVIKGTDKIWVSIPKDKPSELINKTVFVDLGSDVYAAFSPYNSTGLDSTTCSKDNAYMRHNWSFNSSQIGALVLEVGTKKEHGSYANFKTAVSNNAKISSPATDQVKYISTSGKSLKVQSMPRANYDLYCGGGDDDGGVLPKVWTDDNLIDFETWNSYEVVYGDKIVEQKWGVGVLSLQSNENNLTIQINPENGEATWWEKDATAPESPTALPVTICGNNGSATLTVSDAVNAATYYWYENLTDNTPISQGSSFTTPVLSNSQTYYVTRFEGGKESMKTPVSVRIIDMPEDIIVPDDEGIPTDQLEFYLPFPGDENDYSGNGYEKSYAYNTNYVANRFNKDKQAYSFEGSWSYLYYNNSLSFTGNESRSISFWANTDQFNNGAVVAMGYPAKALQAFTLKTGTTENTWILDLGSDDHEHEFTVANTSGSWHHWILTYDGTTVKVYCDKNEVFSVDANLETYKYNVYFGRSYYSSENYIGKIDEVSFYNKVLSTTEINQLYTTKGFITDLWTEAEEISNEQLKVTIHNSQDDIVYFLQKYNGISWETVSSQIVGGSTNLILTSDKLSDLDDIVIIAQNRGTCNLKLDTTFNSTGVVYTDIEEMKKSNPAKKFFDLKIYPNPTNGILKVESNITEFDNISIYNLMGEQMLYFEDVNQINLTTLPNGLYLIKFSVNNQQIIKKVAKR